MNVLKAIVTVCLAGYLGVAVYLFLMQGRMVFRPYRGLEATPAEAGLVYEDLRLESEGETIHGWYVPAQQSRGTVLFCHGNAGNISHRLPTLTLLNGLGMNILLFDYQGYGESTGSASEAGTYADAAACWQWLMDRGERPERVVIMGRSLGGAVAAQCAETVSESGATIAGLVLESTFSSVPDMGAHLYPWLPVRALSRISYATGDRLARGAITCPVLVAHSPDDDVVPYALGQAVLEKAGTSGRFLELTGDHNSGYQTSGERYVSGLNEFFKDVLPVD